MDKPSSSSSTAAQVGLVASSAPLLSPPTCSKATRVTTWPNINWCKSHKVETIRTNIYHLTLTNVCCKNNLPLTNYTTGCIFEYNSAHLFGFEIGFKEHNSPNLTGSFYFKTKAMA
ncbi:dTDP-4-dehydrorhamnose 3,5-epimerase/dTDP-4-dehydrorhamnose reductase [Spatholobus suberectus]|nr:dTDP-4-dehydrorhamnose 3,5-epimerase/dTDP-4-dehydrorhamnose reductase [Spatholobus suberectus]